MTPHSASSPNRTSELARALLFVYVILVACPIRYWPVTPGTDETWIFALNYAAAHALAVGRDVVWTTGPLGYLAFPQDIGNNLAKGLAFQSAIWILLIAIFWDLFFRNGIALRNLAAFSVLFGLSAPLYWFNYIGVENLLVAGTLILLLVVRIRGGTGRYITALVLIGIIPLIKLTGGVIVAGALGGFLLDRVIRLRWKAWRGVALGVAVPVMAAALTCWLTLPSIASVRNYLAASMDIAGAFSAAMSMSGRPVEFLMGAEILILVGVLLWLVAIDQRRLAGFYALLLAVPMMISLKHGFVRQDVHLVNFVCFAALAMGLISLQVGWTQRFRLLLGTAIVLPFLMLWQDYAASYYDLKPLLAEVGGVRAIWFAGNALVRYSSVRQRLHTWAEDEMQSQPDARLEPEIRAIIGSSPVASMSIDYSGVFLEGLNLRLYPVVQRYSAYTPLLDGLNAAWIRDQGPRFLLFDGSTIDDRDPWAETPAMWLEVYRWYNTRLLGSRNLLLERRTEPRFQRMESIGRTITSPTAGLRFPASATPVFWTMNCPLNAKGKMQKLLFRLSEVDAVEKTCSGDRDPRRVLMDNLTSPVMGNFLPGSLAEFAMIFEDRAPACPVEAIRFESGTGSYSERCEVEFFRPAREPSTNQNK